MGRRGSGRVARSICSSNVSAIWLQGCGPGFSTEAFRSARQPGHVGGESGNSIPHTNGSCLGRFELDGTESGPGFPGLPESGYDITLTFGLREPVPGKLGPRDLLLVQN
jgi:hypothetical protein